MRKREELVTGCMSRAGDEEMTFVLLSRDVAAPDAIRYWAMKRLKLGKNRADDPQITEAEQCARTMEAERGKHKPTGRAAEAAADTRRAQDKDAGGHAALTRIAERLWSSENVEVRCGGGETVEFLEALVLERLPATGAQEPQPVGALEWECVASGQPGEHFAPKFQTPLCGQVMVAWVGDDDDEPSWRLFYRNRQELLEANTPEAAVAEAERRLRAFFATGLRALDGARARTRGEGTAAE